MSAQVEAPLAEPSQPPPGRGRLRIIVDMVLCGLPLAVGLVAVLRIPSTTAPGFTEAARFVRDVATAQDLVVVVGAPLQDAGAALRGVPFVVANAMGRWPDSAPEGPKGSGAKRYFVVDARGSGAQLQLPKLGEASDTRVFSRVRVTEHRMAGSPP